MVAPVVFARAGDRRRALEPTRRERVRCPPIGTSVSGSSAEEDGERGPWGEIEIRGGGMAVVSGTMLVVSLMLGVMWGELVAVSRLLPSLNHETDSWAVRSTRWRARSKPGLRRWRPLRGARRSCAPSAASGSGDRRLARVAGGEEGGVGRARRRGRRLGRRERRLMTRARGGLDHVGRGPRGEPRQWGEIEAGAGTGWSSDAGASGPRG